MLSDADRQASERGAPAAQAQVHRSRIKNVWAGSWRVVMVLGIGGKGG